MQETAPDHERFSRLTMTKDFVTMNDEDFRHNTDPFAEEEP